MAPPVAIGERLGGQRRGKLAILDDTRRFSTILDDSRRFSTILENPGYERSPRRDIVERNAQTVVSPGVWTKKAQAVDLGLIR